MDEVLEVRTPVSMVIMAARAGAALVLCALLVASCTEESARIEKPQALRKKDKRTATRFNSSASSSKGVSRDTLTKFREELAKKTRDKLDELDRRVAQNPDDASVYYARGLFFYKAENSELALSDIDKALEKGGKRFETYKLRSQINQALSDVPAALDDLNHALALKTFDRAALTERGLIYFNMGKYDEALADLDKAVASDDRDRFAHSARASLHMKLKRYDKALEDFSTMLKYHPHVEGVRQRRMDLEMQLGKFEKALDDANMILKDNPEDATIYKVRGDINFKLSRKDQAIADYSKAIALERSFVQAYEARAAVYLAEGKTELAVRDRDSSKAIREKKSEALPKLLE